MTCCSDFTNKLEKHVNFYIYELIFTASFQFLIFSFDSLVEKLDKTDFKYFSQDFDSKVLDSVRQKKFFVWI